MAWTGLNLTVDGRNALNQAQTDKKLNFKSIVVGDGNTPDNFSTQKRLVHQLYELNELKIDITDTGCILTADLPEVDYDYYFREIGVLVTTENGDKLYVYDNSGDDAQYIVNTTAVEKTQKRIRLSLIVSDVDNITVSTPGILYVSYKEFENTVEEMLIHRSDTTIHVTEAEKDKLKGIEEGANRYIHPDAHPAEMISTDENHRFVSDMEKEEWGNAVNTSKTYSDEMYRQATGYTDKKVADLIAGAPESLDTLKEVADAINENESVMEALDDAIGKKANQAELDTHTGNDTIHITATEHEKLKNAVSKTGDASNTTVTFTQAAARTKPASGDKLSVIVGKIAKWFNDIKTVAFSGSYNDLTDTPSSMTAKGGDSDTVNGHTVESDVPANAKFTDTTYGEATASGSGLMSAADKKELVLLKTPFATCATGRATAAKVAVLANFVLTPGARIVVKFTDTAGTSNPASGSLTLNVNNTGAKTMAYSRNGAKSAVPYSWGNYFYNNMTHIFEYDGTYWLCTDWNADNNTTYVNFGKSGPSAKAGLVPAPPNTVGNTKCLREDGVWGDPLASGDAGKLTVEFSESESKTPLGIGTGWTLSRLFASLYTWLNYINNLSDVAFSGSYDDLSDTPGEATLSTSGLVKVTNSSTVIKSDGLALAASEKNASVEGTLAYKIANINNMYSCTLGSGSQHFNQGDNLLKASMTMPAGVYLFTINGYHEAGDNQYPIRKIVFAAGSTSVSQYYGAACPGMSMSCILKVTENPEVGLQISTPFEFTTHSQWYVQAVKLK